MTLLKNNSSSAFGYPKIHCFTTFFYSTLRDKGYPSVQRWTRKAKVFEMDRLLIPIHLGNHWCMGGIDFATKTVLYFDSLLGSSHKFYQV